MPSNPPSMSLMQKLHSARAEDPVFDRSHRTVCGLMAVWAGIVVLDRLIGLTTGAYQAAQLPYALAGGALLVFVAFLGTRGHIQGALMLMQINMAVFLLQFAATCFLYREHTALWSTLFYGISAGLLTGNSLHLFLNRDMEAYRAKVRQLQGKQDAAPRYYRTHSRMVRNRK